MKIYIAEASKVLTQNYYSLFAICRSKKKLLKFEYELEF